MSSKEVLEKPEDGSVPISLKVKSQNGNEVFFKIKRSSQLKNLMCAYCVKQSVDIDSFAFYYNGHLLKVEHTPAELGMENGNTVINAIELETFRPSKRTRPNEDSQAGPPAESQAIALAHTNSDSPQGVAGHAISDLPGKIEDILTYTFDELKNRTSSSFMQAAAFVEGSFCESIKKFEAAQKHITKELFDFKVEAEKKITERDILIEKMHLQNKELQQMNASFTEERAHCFAQLEKYQTYITLLKKELEEVKLLNKLEHCVSARAHGGPIGQKDVPVGNENKNLTECSIPICLKVKGLDGQQVFFKIPSNRELKGLMNAYCLRQLLDFNSVDFMFNGHLIGPDQTPNELQMKDDDEIVAWLCLSGGAIC